jgi:hypothetical protein
MLLLALQTARINVIAWDALFKPSAKSARYLDHLFAETSTYYFHSQAHCSFFFFFLTREALQVKKPLITVYEENVEYGGK